MPGKVRQLHGGASADPGRAGHEPEPPEQPMVPPTWLTERGLVVWHEVVPALVHMGYVYACDTSVVVAFCETEAERRRLAMLVSQSTPLLQGAHSKGRDGPPELVRNPLMMMFVHTTMSVARLAGELGLSPRGRTELRFLSQPADDDRLRLLSS